MANENTALARRPEAAPAPFDPADLEQAYTLAENLAKASLLPSYLRGKPADVFLTLLLGRDLGLTAMQAITGIHVIEGKPSVSAQLAVALVKRSPACAYFRLVESTAQVATYETQRRGEPAPQRMSFTIEQARAANLAGKGNWKSYPEAMLRARAAMALARDVYPDVVANVYDPEELERIGTIDTTEAPPYAPPPPSRPASEQRPAPAPAPSPEKPKRVAACGSCGGAAADHEPGRIDASCPHSVTKAPTPSEAPASAGTAADGFIARMRAATTGAEMDVIASELQKAFRGGAVSDDERKAAMRPWREESERIAAGLPPGQYPQAPGGEVIR